MPEPHRNWLAFNKDNSFLSCGCGNVCVSYKAWKQATEHQRQDWNLLARKCRTCQLDKQYKNSKELNQ